MRPGGKKDLLWECYKALMTHEPNELNPSDFDVLSKLTSKFPMREQDARDFAAAAAGNDGRYRIFHFKEKGRRGSHDGG